MLGAADYRAFAVAVLVFPMLPGPGAFALPAFTGKRGLRAGAIAVSIARPALAHRLLRAAFADAVAARVRAYRGAPQRRVRTAGVFLVGFGIERAMKRPQALRARCGAPQCAADCAS